jgi:hypothetical protein
MFTQELIGFARRKEQLIAQAGQQRTQILSDLTMLEKPLAVADRGVMAGRYVAAHPWLAGVGVAAVAVLGRRNLAKWAGRGWAAWRLWRTVNRWMQ